MVGPIQMEPIRPLSERWRSVLRFLVDGMTDREIARELETTEQNAQKYVVRIRKRVGAANRAQLVAWAISVQGIRPSWAPE